MSAIQKYVLDFIHNNFLPCSVEVYPIANSGAIVIDENGQFLIFFLNLKTGKVCNDHTDPKAYARWRADFFA